jgi:shikimate dehydrogenase
VSGPAPPGRLGVLGWPVAHSRSPAMHEAAFAALGLTGWTYQRLPVPDHLFAETVRALGAAGFAGANVTIPHKEAALAVADEASELARTIGAANTLTFAGGRIEADNTDAPGLIAALEGSDPLSEVDSRGPTPPPRRALVLGAGGSARAAVVALRGAGAEVAVWNRTADRARRLAADLRVTAVEAPVAADLLVNCTAVGLEDPDASPVDAIEWATVVDLVYGDRETALVGAARAAGARVVDGLEVLVQQGALSFARWTGRRPPLEAMRAAARAR